MDWNEPGCESNGKSKTTTTAERCSESTGQPFPATTTSRALIGDSSSQLMCFAGDHPVNRSALSGSDVAQQIHGISGRKLYRRLELYGPDGCFLKMLLGWSSTLPRASSLCWKRRDIPTRHGGKLSRSIYRLALSERRTFAIEFGLLPTLLANRWGFPDSHGTTSAWMNYLLPTLKASDGSKGMRTPEGTARERQRRKNGLDLPTVIGGRVHPMFAEWMFGYPIGHTELRPSETASSRKLRRRSGE